MSYQQMQGSRIPARKSRRPVATEEQQFSTTQGRVKVPIYSTTARQQRAMQADARQAQAGREEEDDDDSVWDQRRPRGVVPYQRTMPSIPNLGTLPNPGRRSMWGTAAKAFALTLLGSAGIFEIFQLGGAAIENLQEQWHYGDLRLTATDAVVGHGDSLNTPSHFITEILKGGRIAIIEIPGGNFQKTLVYANATLVSNGAVQAVTLTFRDVNGDGKPDMVIHLAGNSPMVMINAGDKFRPLNPGESVNL